MGVMCSLLHCKKNSVEFTVKYWQLWLPELYRRKYGHNVTVNFTLENCYLFTVICCKNNSYHINLFTVNSFKNNIYTVNLITVHQ